MRYHHRFTVYKSADGWRWRCHSANGRNVANGSEAYASRSNAERACMRLVDALVMCGRCVARRTDFATAVLCYSN